MSGLEKQIVPVVFAKGMNVKSNNKAGAPGELVSLTNATFQTTQRITKRNGHTALPSTGVAGGSGLTNGLAMFTRQQELLVADGALLLSYSSAQSGWANRGRLVPATLSTLPALSPAAGQSLAGYDASVSSAGLMLCAAEQWSPVFSWSLGGIIYSVIDTNTGTTLLGQVALPSTSFAPKCIATSDRFLLYYVDGAIFGLYCISIPYATLAAAAAVRVDSNSLTVTQVNATTPSYDVTYSGGSLFAAMSCQAGGVTVLKGSPASPGFGSHLSVSSTAVSSCCIFADAFNGNIAIGWTLTGGTTAQFAVVSSGLAAVAAAQTLDATGGGHFSNVTGISNSTAGSSLLFFVDYYDGSRTARDLIRLQVAYGVSYSMGTAVTFARGASPAGKPYQVTANGDWYLPVAFSTGSAVSGEAGATVNTQFVLNSAGLVVAKIAPGTFAGRPTGNLALLSGVRPYVTPESSVVSLKAYLPSAQVTRFTIEPGTSGTFLSYQSAIELVSLDHSGAGALSRTELAQSAQLGGAVVNNYDGNAAAELGYHYPPYMLSATQAAGAGAVAAGTYQYAACYEWTDAQGLVHRSSPSIALSVVVGAPATTVTLTIPTLRLTQKAGVRICVYRTISNGTVFYLLNNTGAVSDSLLNSTSSDSVTWADTLADATILGRAQLYTTGGVLENDAPPALGPTTIHRSRVIGISSESPLELWYSKQATPGAPVEFSASLTLNIDPRGGPCTALASLDDKLVVFKADRIFAITGQGPDSTGAQSDWSDSMLVSSDCGCTYPESVVVVPDGLMLQSQKGVYLLGRDLVARYVGAPVESYNGQAIVAANLVPSTNQVRFAQAAQTLVYDYFVGQWSVFTTSQVDALIWKSQYARLRSAGVVAVEAIGTYTDEGSFIPLSFTTSWISLAGLQGFKRIRKLMLDGASLSASNLTLQVYVDLDNTTPVQTVAFPTTGADWQERIFTTQQKCEAIQLTLTESQASVAGAYLDVTALTFEVAAKRGAYKLPASRSTS
jgi:hypothetical protein